MKTLWPSKRGDVGSRAPGVPSGRRHFFDKKIIFGRSFKVLTLLSYS